MRTWALKWAASYDTTPATLYMLLVLAHDDPAWDELSTDEQAATVGTWFDTDSHREQMRLLRVQGVALADYEVGGP